MNVKKTKEATKKAHALVIGGGIAGLLAARILAKHFDRITLIERDHYPGEPAHRPGVPQDRQVHTMLLKGQNVLEEWFPGLSTKLFARGAQEQFYGNKSIYVYGGRRSTCIPPVLRGWNCSRILVEWQIRQELQCFSQIHFLEGLEVVHLLHENGSVRGVQVRNRGEGENTLQECEADLVVDASGAGSRTPQWLQEAGYEPPQESIIDAHLGYATRLYESPADFHPDWTGIMIQAVEPQRRGGTLMRIEGDRWMVVLAGANEDYPSTNNEEYLAFAQSLPDPVLYEAIKDAKPVSPIYGYRRTANCWRHFERLKCFPEHLVVMGDAACSFNPVYGQGMTVAALEALELDVCLQQYTQRQATGFSRAFQRHVAHVLRFPWLFVSAADAPKKEKPGLASKYRERLLDLLAQDTKILLTFLEISHMLRTPLALLHPAIVTKVLTHRVSKGRPDD